MTRLFNERALKKRHQPGERNGPITLLSPPLRSTLAVGLLIAVGGGLWATLARIPVSVQGTGVLLPVSSINSSLSNSSGVAIWMFNQPAQPWHQLARRYRDQPDQLNNAQVVDLTRLILAAAGGTQNPPGTVSGSSSAGFSDNLKRNFFGRQLQPGQLLVWVQSSSQKEKLVSSLDELTRTLRDTQNKQRNIEQKQVILQQELFSRQSYLEKMGDLERRGFVSRSSILQEQADVDNIKSQILSNKNEIISIENDVARAYQLLRNELAALINKEMVFAPLRPVYLSQVVPNNGESVNEGQELLELSDDSLDEPVLVPLFLSSREMAQVFPGMEILATPTGYQRSEVGGIHGRVVSMAKLPSGLEDVQARVGVKSLAQVIMTREPAPTLAVLALERAGAQASLNSGGYRWSSSGPLPFPPTPGDRLDVEVTTRKVAPIALAIPILRQVFGFTPPSSPVDSGGNAQPAQKS